MHIQTELRKQQSQYLATPFLLKQNQHYKSIQGNKKPLYVFAIQTVASFVHSTKPLERLLGILIGFSL